MTKDGESEPYENEAHRGLNLRIGDADTTITGLHEYVISYVVEGALSGVSDMTGVYWNVIGNQWEIPIERTEVTIRVKDSGGGGEVLGSFIN